MPPPMMATRFHIVREKRRFLADGQVGVEAHGDVADEQAAEVGDGQAVRRSRFDEAVGFEIVRESSSAAK